MWRVGNQHTIIRRSEMRDDTRLPRSEEARIRERVERQAAGIGVMSAGASFACAVAYGYG